MCVCVGPIVIATWSAQNPGRARSVCLPSGFREQLVKSLGYELVVWILRAWTDSKPKESSAKAIDIEFFEMKVLEWARAIRMVPEPGRIEPT